MTWTVRMSDNLPGRVQILGHAHIICITVRENGIIYCQIFCDLLLKSALERIFNGMQLILVKIKWHIKWKYLIQIFHDICLSYYFKYLLNMFCYAKQVYEYCVCESTFIRGHQYSWYLQNALIHRLLNSWFHTLEVANQLKRFYKNIFRVYHIRIIAKIVGSHDMKQTDSSLIIVRNVCVLTSASMIVYLLFTRSWSAIIGTK
jgi:hypothetical protein